MSEINAIHVLNIPRQDYVYPSQGKSFENRYLIIDGANQNQPYLISQQFVLSSNVSFAPYPKEHSNASHGSNFTIVRIKQG